MSPRSWPAMGSTPRRRGDWPWALPDHPGKIQGLIFERTDVHQLTSASTQIDVRFSPWPGCLICESFGGLGETRESRINAALEAFASNTLHVLLKAFLEYPLPRRRRMSIRPSSRAFHSRSPTATF